MESKTKEVKSIENTLVRSIIEISNSSANIFLKVRDVTHASLNLRQVVVTNKTIDQTSNEASGIIETKLVSDSLGVGGSLDITKLNKKQVSNNFTSLEVILSSKISSQGRNVSLDFNDMTSGVLLDLCFKSIDILDNR